MGCQHGNGYKRCQDSKSKLLLAGYLASIEHVICHTKTQPHTIVPSIRSNNRYPLHANQLPPTTPGSLKRHNRINQSPYSRHDTSHRSSNPSQHPTLFPIFFCHKKIPRHRTPNLYSIFYPADVLCPDDKISTHLHPIHTRKKVVQSSPGLA